MGRRRGVTVVEVLAVIAVISILMAALLPVLNRVREQARMTRCRSNLGNYGLAASTYSGDHDGEFPYSPTWLANWAVVNCNWHNASENLALHPEHAGDLWPYVKGRNIHVCPTFDIVARRTSCPRCRGATIPVEPQYGYAMNAHLNGDVWTNMPTQYQAGIKDLRKQSQVKQPARTSCFGEENTWPIPGISTTGINDNNLNSTPREQTDCFGTFHEPPGGDFNLGVSNAAFVDGHVESVTPYPPGNTYQLSWPGDKPAPLW